MQSALKTVSGEPPTAQTTYADMSSQTFNLTDTRCSSSTRQAPGAGHPSHDRRRRLLTAAQTLAACGSALSLTGWPMVVYAPLSRVELGGSTAIAEQMAANSVSMSGSAAVQPVSALVNLNRLGAKAGAPAVPADRVRRVHRPDVRAAGRGVPGRASQGC